MYWLEFSNKFFNLSIARKITNGLIKNGHDVINFDYRNHNIHTNNLLAEKNADGSVTIIISKKPQKGNWLDTAAHKQGTMLWRWTGAKNHPLPKVEIINV